MPWPVDVTSLASGPATVPLLVPRRAPVEASGWRNQRPVIRPRPSGPATTVLRTVRVPVSKAIDDSARPVWTDVVITVPNAMVATLTYLPFILNASITTLTSLDFLGFGLPLDAPSFGRLLSSAKSNLHAPWIGISTFLTLATMLILLIFIGEAVRDALDPRKAIASSEPETPRTDASLPTTA